MAVVICLHIMVGTVLLGSVSFMTLADVLPLVESFIGAALLSRMVVIIELHGLKGALAGLDEQHDGMLDRGAPESELKLPGTPTVIATGRSSY